MKVFFRNIHLYLSLAAGLVIMTCCFSGAVLVFENEWQQLAHHDRYFVKEQEEPQSVETMVEAVKKQYPTATVASVKLYTAKDRSAEIGISLPQKEQAVAQKPKEKIAAASQKEKAQAAAPNAKRPPGGRPTHTVFINPYTAQVLELYSYRDTFFFTMFSLHRWLLGGDDSIGKTITGVSTFIFLFILITGIILWWPRNKAILKQRLKIKTDANWKRLTHDFHIVLGFYASIFLFIFAFTALAWSFQWFNDGIYTLTNSTNQSPEPPQSVLLQGSLPISYDAALSAIRNKATDAEYYSLRAPNSATGIYAISVLPAGAPETAADNYFVDQYSGKLLGVLHFADKNLGQRVRATFKPVHVGSVYGLPSKIIAFLACLLGVTFPITGIIMWINRLKKNASQPAAAAKRKTMV